MSEVVAEFSISDQNIIYIYRASGIEVEVLVPDGGAWASCELTPEEIAKIESMKPSADFSGLYFSNNKKGKLVKATSSILNLGIVSGRIYSVKSEYAKNREVFYTIIVSAERIVSVEAKHFTPYSKITT